jgi:hypothetical protein
MRLLQFHEYLGLLDGGAKTIPAADSHSRVWLQQAQALWPQLRLGSWTRRARNVESVARCHASGTRLVHVSANWQNCYLILVVPPRRVQAESYLLFDIGAEYRKARLICPAFDLDQTADEKTIRMYVPLLHGNRNPFAILETGKDTYIQAYAEGGRFDVEHQLVSVSSHYIGARKVSAKTVVDLFVSYAFGRYEWARAVTWKKLEL